MLKQKPNTKCLCKSGKKYKFCCAKNEINKSFECNECGFTIKETPCLVCKDIKECSNMIIANKNDPNCYIPVKGIRTKYGKNGSKILELIHKKVNILNKSNLNMQCYVCQKIFNYKDMFTNDESGANLCFECIEKNNGTIIESDAYKNDFYCRSKRNKVICID